MEFGQNATIATNLRRVYQRGGMLGRNKREIVAVGDVSFAIPRGTIFGMLGPNGAGKSAMGCRRWRALHCTTWASPAWRRSSSR